MSKTISIIKAGFYTSVQDSGRTGFAHLGVPESGAMDMASFYLANLLLNNLPDAAMLECTLVGPSILFSSETHFVITGGNAQASIDGKAVTQGVPTLAKPSQLLVLSKITDGSRCYLAFAGGLQTEIALNSRSWYARITMYTKLSKRMSLPLGNSDYGTPKGAHLRPLPASLCPEGSSKIEVYKGPEFSLLSEKQQASLQQKFTVSNLWNRMAIQLLEIVPNSLEGIRTSPVLPGTVQLTPSGTLIVLARDCQTTGGYPRVLQVSESEMNIIGQLQQGDHFLFSIT